MNEKLPPDESYVENYLKLVQWYYNYAKDQLNKFWTSEDHEKLDVHAFANRIHKSTNVLQHFASEFQKSEDVQKIWTDFCNNVIYTKKRVLRSKINFVDEINDPTGTVLETQAIEREKREEKIFIRSTLENYFNELPSTYLKWVILVIRIFFILLYFSFHSISTGYVYRMRSSWEIYGNLSQVGFLTEMSGRMAHIEANTYITLPPVFEIAKILNIDEEEARYLSQRTVDPITESELNDISQYLLTIPSFGVIHVPWCEPVTSNLLIKKFNNGEGPEQDKVCSIFSLVTFKEDLLNFADNYIRSLKAVVTVGDNNSIILLLAILGIISVIYFYLLYKDYQLRQRCFHVLNRISLIRGGNNYVRSYDLQSTVKVSIGLWFFCILLLIFVLQGSACLSNSYREKITKLGQETRSVARITASSHFLMAMQDLVVAGRIRYDRVRPAIEEEYLRIINAINSLDLGVSDTFDGLFCIGNFSGKGENSCSLRIIDFAENIRRPNFSMESYEFHYSRKLYFDYITPMIKKTLRDMTAKAHINAQDNGMKLYLYCYFVIPLYLLIWIFFEYQNSHIDFWIRGICLLCRNAIIKDQKLSTIFVSILEGKDDEYIEESPFPTIVTTAGANTDSGRIKSIVITANSKMYELLQTSADHMFSQQCPNFEFISKNIIKYEVDEIVEKEEPKEEKEEPMTKIELFINGENEFHFKEKVHRKRIVLYSVEEMKDENNNIISIFKDVTDYHYDNEQMKNIISNHSMPSEVANSRFNAYVAFVYFSVPLEFDEITLLSSKEKENSGIMRTELTSSKYTFIIKSSVEDVENKTKSFINTLFGLFNKHSMSASLTKGDLIVSHLLEDDCLPVIIGDCVDRINHMHCYAKESSLVTDIPSFQEHVDGFLDNIEIIKFH